MRVTPHSSLNIFPKSRTYFAFVVFVSNISQYNDFDNKYLFVSSGWGATQVKCLWGGGSAFLKLTRKTNDYNHKADTEVSCEPRWSSR